MSTMINAEHGQAASATDPDNKELQGNDKAPGEEAGRGEQVTNEDLKGKKVDADPGNKDDVPIDQQRGQSTSGQSTRHS